jgi:hypothetical protein
MLIIDSWFGRLGNNILQILRAIHYGILNKHNCIKFLQHNYFIEHEIVLHNEEDKQNTIKNNFFYLKHFNMKDPEPYIMKKYFQTYILPVFKVKPSLNEMDNTDILHIHFRGGDIFSNNPHKAYIQPPLSYYTNITKYYNKIKLICEDTLNPCINELMKLDNVEYTSTTLENDLKILCTSQNLVIGFGTFGFLLYLMNTNLKNLYLPKYFVNELPQGSWGNDIKVHIIELPNYIKVGEWRNSVEQRKMMLKYT